MTGPRDRRGAPKIRPSQVIAVIAVLGLFVAGVVVGGILGALLVGVLAVAAGVLLAARWSVLDPRIRIFRAGAVIAAAAVAISLLGR